ncbi:MAG: HAD family phosphatase [Clostridiales bacterium]|nr:HAD family phosphatase [Clostridiales bacterium]
MHKKIRIIALDLDGTLLNSKKELTPENRAALEKAAEAGIEIVPTTGRFYNGMPQFIRDLPFLHYAITINGAEVYDIRRDTVVYKAELPLQQAIEIMNFLEDYPLLYDCYLGGGGWISQRHKDMVDDTIRSPHYRHMLHTLRKPVPELRDFIAELGQDIQKIQFFTKDEDLRLRLMDELPQRFENLSVSSSVDQNCEINTLKANKGEALMALADYLGVDREATMSFGDGLNDLSMLKAAGVGVAMANACPEAKEAADDITLSCEESGVAKGIEKYCF